MNLWVQRQPNVALKGVFLAEKSWLTPHWVITFDLYAESWHKCCTEWMCAWISFTSQNSNQRLVLILSNQVQLAITRMLSLLLQDLMTNLHPLMGVWDNTADNTVFYRTALPEECPRMNKWWSEPAGLCCPAQSWWKSISQKCITFFVLKMPARI